MGRVDQGNVAKVAELFRLLGENDGPGEDFETTAGPSHHRDMVASRPDSDGRLARVEAFRVEGTGAPLDVLPHEVKQHRIGHARNLSWLIFPGKQTTIPAYATGDWVGGPRTVVKASALGPEAAMNIYGDLCVEEVRKTRSKDHTEWRVLREARRIPPEESRRTFQEVQKRYH